MIKKLALGSVGLLLLSVPLISSADCNTSPIDCPAGQVLVYSPSSGECPTGNYQCVQGVVTTVAPTTAPVPAPAVNNTSYLAFGSRGSAVIDLQNKLVSLGLLDADNISGYFGALTRAAVRSFQSTHGIVSSGDESTTGFGMVGPKTLSGIDFALSLRTSRTQVNRPANTPPAPPAGPAAPATPPVAPAISSSTVSTSDNNCNNGHVGLVRYDLLLKSLVYCDGSKWITVPSSGGSTGDDTIRNLMLPHNGYINWSPTAGEAGFGIRENSGTLEFKNSGGVWATLQKIITDIATPLIASSGGGGTGGTGGGISGYEIVQSSIQVDDIWHPGFYSRIASCPAGKKVLGGGCFVGYGLPSGDTKWLCHHLPAATSADYAAYAICANASGDSSAQPQEHFSIDLKLNGHDDDFSVHDGEDVIATWTTTGYTSCEIYQSRWSTDVSSDHIEGLGPSGSYTFTASNAAPQSYDLVCHGYAANGSPVEDEDRILVTKI